MIEPKILETCWLIFCTMSIHWLVLKTTNLWIPCTDHRKAVYLLRDPDLFSLLIIICVTVYVTNKKYYTLVLVVSSSYHANIDMWARIKPGSLDGTCAVISTATLQQLIANRNQTGRTSKESMSLVFTHIAMLPFMV